MHLSLKTAAQTLPLDEMILKNARQCFTIFVWFSESCAHSCSVGNEKGKQMNEFNEFERRWVICYFCGIFNALTPYHYRLKCAIEIDSHCIWCLALFVCWAGDYILTWRVFSTKSEVCEMVSWNEPDHFSDGKRSFLPP